MRSLKINRLHTLTISILLTTALFMWPTWASLAELWSKMDYPYSYGFLGTALCFYFLWELFNNAQEEGTGETPPTSAGQILLLLATVGASLLWFVTESLQVSIGSQLLLVAIITCAIGAMLGVNTLFKTLQAIFFLAMSVPVWNYLNGTLQSMTTSAVTFALELTSIPAYIEGNFISLPFGTLEVAGGCSGLRYFLVSIMLAHFYNLQYIHSTKSKVAIMLVTVIVGILANWIRVFGLVLVGYYSEMQHELITESHEFYGWVIYAICMVPVFYFFRHFDAEAEPQKTVIAFNKPSNSLLTLTVLAIAIGPMLVWSKGSILNKQNLTSPSWTTTSPDGWYQAAKFEEKNTEWSLGFEGYAFEQNESFKSRYARKTINLHSVFYTHESQGKELVNDENKLTNDDAWFIQPAPATLSVPQSLRVKSNVAERGFAKQIMMSFYQVGEKRSLGGLGTKLDQFKAMLDVTTPKSFNLFVMRCRSNCEDESGQLSAFIDEFIALNRLQPSEKL